MKKLKIILFLLICIITLTGCNKQEETQKKEKPQEKQMQNQEIKVPEYVDNNQTPISFYQLQGNKLVKLTEITKKLNVEEDIGTFQIFPSNEDTIYLNKSFSESYYDEWTKYNQNNSIKLGFNIKFTILNNENVSYNIFTPDDAMKRWEHLMNYLYDDYVNRNMSFYSHIEQNQLTDTTLFTAIKLQASYQCSEITSPIQLTVFTYDTDDDFLDNEYRGNSKYTFTINTI